MVENIQVVRPRGRLDSGTGPAFEKDLLTNIDSGVKKLILDFSDLQYISSAGLRVVLVVSKKMKSIGGRVTLCSLSRQVNEVFEISGFNSIVDIVPSYDDAVARLSGAS